MTRVIVVLVPLAIVATLAAQQPSPAAGTVAITVTESAGMRRTEFPVRATVSLAQRTLPGTDAAAHVRLMQADAEVPAQYTVMASWPDGSARSVDVDFNASLAPNEKREYRLEYGANVTAAQKPRGLTVTETADAVQIGNIKFGRNASPLIQSANYRGEFIGQGQNGFAALDAADGRHDLSTAIDLKVEIVKRGPLVALLQYTGKLTIDGAAVPFTLTLEMPNSKSWLKSSIELTNASRRVKTLSFDTPFALGAFPWLWDFGTENDTYGVFRAAADGALFTQVVVPSGGRGQASNWNVQNTAQGQLRPYEVSVAAPGRSSMASGWGHFQGPTLAIPFAFQDFGNTPGTYVVSLNGQGQASWQFSPSGTATTHRFGIYQHFVTTPVPVGAATSPASMVHAPTVTVQR